MAQLAQLGVFRNIVKLSAVEIGLGGQLVPLGIHEFATGLRLSLFKLSEPVLYSFELSRGRSTGVGGRSAHRTSSGRLRSTGTRRTQHAPACKRKHKNLLWTAATPS
jgi:hypothetical protein